MVVQINNVRITCSKNNQHISVSIDLSVEKGKEWVLWMVGQGNCPMCGAPLLTTNEQDQNRNEKVFLVSESYEERSGEIQTKGIKPVKVPQTLVYSTNCKRKGMISAHISQLLPIKAAVDILAGMIVEEKSKLLPMEIFETPIKHLQEIRFNLIKLENRFDQTKRGTRPSAGFPFHYEEDMPQMWYKNRDNFGKKRKKDIEERKEIAEKSWLRFRNTVFGGISRKEEVKYGALYNLGLVDIIRDGGQNYIGLTSAGAELSAINNPLIHNEDFSNITRENLEKRFSLEEQNWFWNHVTEYISAEAKSITTCIKMTMIENAHVSLITEELVRRNEDVRKLSTEGSPPPRRAYTSSVVNRWTGLGFLERPSKGSYITSDLGKNKFTQYQEKTSSPSWQRSK